MNPFILILLVWIGFGGVGLFFALLAAKKKPNSAVGQRLNTVFTRNNSYIERRTRGQALAMLACLLGPLMFIVALIIYTGYGQDHHS